MLPLRSQSQVGGLQTSLSLVSSDPVLSPDEPRSNSDNIRESPAESASSQETWPTADAPTTKKTENGKAEINCLEQKVIHRVSSADKVTLQDIARESVGTICEKMHRLPEEYLEELKNGLRVILEGGNGSQHREEFFILQKFVQGRTDLTAKTLVRAHRVQLEILVAINTGIQGFLHPSISLSQNSLIEIFGYKRCRNIACQNQLPADDCTCEICNNTSGFCNLCMCVICNKFDFEVNTCRWIGCDLCSHWTHTDCAIRQQLICMGPSSKSGAGPSEMVFRCQACNRTSELLGWVKDVFQHCAPSWDGEALTRELDYVSRIFHGSKDPRLSFPPSDLPISLSLSQFQFQFSLKNPNHHTLCSSNTSPLNSSDPLAFSPYADLIGSACCILGLRTKIGFWSKNSSLNLAFAVIASKSLMQVE